MRLRGTNMRTITADGFKAGMTPYKATVEMIERSAKKDNPEGTETFIISATLLHELLKNHIDNYKS